MSGRRFAAFGAGGEGRSRHERSYLGDLLLGPPSRILSAWIEDRFDLVVSTEILEEYRETAGRIGEKFPAVELGAALDRIALHALLVVPVKLPNDACTDRDDIKFLECAVACRADYVVSGDRALLSASGYEGIEVVTPRRFVEQRLTW